MTLSGAHWRNQREGEADAFSIAEGFQAFVVMSNAGPELPLEINRRWPNALIIARLYWPAGDLPGDEAFAAWKDYLDAAAGCVGLVQLGNEPDREIPGITPSEFCLWFLYVKTALQAHFPTLKVGFPMPSVRGQESWDYALWCDPGIRQADFIAEHCYWNNDEGFDDLLWGARYHLTHGRWPKLPLHVTEYGNSDPELSRMEKARQYRTWLRELPAYVRSASVFIMAMG